jgi:RHS repeat-associated protein
VDAAETTTNFLGPRGIECRTNDSTGATSWYLYDGLGSVIAQVADYHTSDANIPVTGVTDYDVFGAVRAGGGTSPQKFCGSLGHTSESTGLIYMRARYMDPATGRFVSEDPAKNGGNWLAYCGNNPVNLVDWQ